jgi:hypothetical protein
VIQYRDQFMELVEAMRATTQSRSEARRFAAARREADPG